MGTKNTAPVARRRPIFCFLSTDAELEAELQMETKQTQFPGGQSRAGVAQG